MLQPIIALAGASGDLGARIARALLARGATVRALVRLGVADTERVRLEAAGLTLAEADPYDLAAMTHSLEGAACVMSALNGLSEVQSVLHS